jgi:hypothetical protein
MDMQFVQALFKSTWNIYGLEAPRITWLATLAIVSGTLVVLLYFSWRVLRAAKRHAVAAAKIQALGREHPLKPGEGLSLDVLDAATRVFEQTRSLQPAWQHFLAQRVLRRSARGEEQVWVANGAEVAFTDAVVIDTQINRPFFSAIPGIVTGLGLLFTFVAILIALLDVRLTGSKQVEGLDLLIKGLSGKFVSSIAALLAAGLPLV